MLFGLAVNTAGPMGFLIVLIGLVFWFGAAQAATKMAEPRYGRR